MTGRHDDRRFDDALDRLARGEAPPDPPADADDRALLDTARTLAAGLRPLRQARPGYQAGLEARLLARLPEATRPWWRRLPRPAPPAGRRRLVALTALLALAVLATGTVATGSAQLRARDPHKGGGGLFGLFRDGGGANTIPLFPPSCGTVYRPIDPLAAARESGGAIAYLPTPPFGPDAVVEVSQPPRSAWREPEGIGMKTHAIVRYRAGDHTVLVVLYEPSPGAARLGELLLGERRIRLPDGREAWAETRVNWPVPATVATVLDRYAVAVASDLPLEEVARLAAQVALIPPTGPDPTPVAILDSRGAGPVASPPPPAPTWNRARGPHPTPTPPGAYSGPPSSGPAALTATGTVRQGGGGSRPRLSYQVSYGNGGCGVAEGVQIAVEFSPVLAGRAVDPPVMPPPHDGGPGFQAGIGGDVTFDTSGLDPEVARRALAEGITVRLTWTEGGQRRERAFPIR